MGAGKGGHHSPLRNGHSDSNGAAGNAASTEEGMMAAQPAPAKAPPLERRPMPADPRELAAAMFAQAARKLPKRPPQR